MIFWQTNLPLYYEEIHTESIKFSDQLDVIQKQFRISNEPYKYYSCITYYDL